MPDIHAAVIAVLRSTKFWPKKHTDKFLAAWLQELRDLYPSVDLLEAARHRRDWVADQVAGGKRKWNHLSGFRNWVKIQHAERPPSQPTSGGMSWPEYQQRIQEQSEHADPASDKARTRTGDSSDEPGTAC